MSNLPNTVTPIPYRIKVLEVVDGAPIQTTISANNIIVNEFITLNASDNLTTTISSQALQAGKNYLWQVTIEEPGGTIAESEWYNFAYKTIPADFDGTLANACDQAALFNGIDIKPEHEFFPPMAANIIIEQLGELTDCGKNIRLVADFANNNTVDTYHAVMLNGEKFVLRDDGMGADQLAGDGLYSIFYWVILQACNKTLIIG